METKDTCFCEESFIDRSFLVSLEILRRWGALCLRKPKQLMVNRVKLSFTRYFFKMFCNVSGVPSICKLHFFFSFYFLFFRIPCIEMSHVYQRVESITETRAGSFFKYLSIIIFLFSFL